MGNRYKIRKAAGSCWLLDMEQDGKNYRKPIEINESGARIWELASQGGDELFIAKELAKEYGIGIEMLKEDVRQFLEGLKNAGVSIETK